MIGAWAAVRLWFSGFTPAASRIAAGVALAIVAGLFIWWWFKTHDDRVIERHQAQQREQDVKALDMSAEERAADAMTNLINEKEREDAITAAPEGGAVSDADLRLNCLRLRKVGRIPEPCRSFSGD